MALPLELYKYYDYREFLRDYYLARKARDRNFSYRWFAMRAGFNSSGLYSSIVQGKVNLTDNTLPKFIAAMKLTDKEEQYFRLMVEFTHAVTASARQEVFDRMIGLLPRKIQRARANQREYYSKWFYTAVHQALAVLEVRANFGELARFIEPPITTPEAKKALLMLQELGLAEPDSEGRWRTTTQTLMAGDEVGAFLVHEYQGALMDLGKESLRRFAKEQRHVSTTTVSVSSEGKERILRKLEEVQREIIEIVRSDSNETQVCQFNLQFFPLTRVS
jgi:uncharacterized protein (TIGR02147 family)